MVALFIKYKPIKTQKNYRSLDGTVLIFSNKKKLVISKTYLKA